MNKGSNQKRPRPRNGKRHSGNKNQVFDSNGPDVRVRGTAHQVLEKYLSLARDASSAGDRISAEGYYQHAEHYYRIISAQNDGQVQQRPPRTPGYDREGPEPLDEDDVVSEADVAAESKVDKADKEDGDKAAAEDADSSSETASAA